MIGRIKGILVRKLERAILLDVAGLTYEIYISKITSTKMSSLIGKEAELVIYHYMKLEHNRGIPVMIGFTDELEKEFFEKFITVSGIGPHAALRAFDKPISAIAQAIEEGDIGYLKGLAGIGPQRAKQIVASLQGKVGRFVLIRDYAKKEEPHQKEVVDEARQVLRRLQYKEKEIEAMLTKVLSARPGLECVEDLLNEIYRQRQ